MDVKQDASASMGARTYHEKTGITCKQREIEADFIRNYVDPATGKIRPGYVSRRNCPLCGADAAEVVFLKNGFEHLHCVCGMIYVAEVLNAEHLNLVYAADEHEGETHDSFRTEPRRSFIRALYQEGTELFSALIPGTRTLLDVGCSSGLYMEYARERGFEVEGIEPSAYAVEYARRVDLEVQQGYFNRDMVGGRRYQVITLWDVLEHCDNPAAILEDARDVLETGGVLFLQVPNVMGLAPRILRQDCNMFTGFGHINLFGPATISDLLSNCGFSDIHLQSVVSEISVVNNYLHYHDPYFGPSTELESVLGLIDLDAIKREHLGYKLQVAARKGS